MDGRILGLGFVSLLALAAGRRGSSLKTAQRPMVRTKIQFERWWDDDKEIILDNFPVPPNMDVDKAVEWLNVKAVEQLRAEIKEALGSADTETIQIELTSREAAHNPNSEAGYLIDGVVSHPKEWRLTREQLVDHIQHDLYDKGSVAGHFELMGEMGSALKTVTKDAPRFKVGDMVYASADKKHLKNQFFGKIQAIHKSGGITVHGRLTSPGEIAYLVKSERTGGLWWLEKNLYTEAEAERRKAAQRKGSALKTVSTEKIYKPGDRVWVRPPRERGKKPFIGTIKIVLFNGGYHVDDEESKERIVDEVEGGLKAGPGWRTTQKGEPAYLVMKTPTGGGVWWLGKYLQPVRSRKKKGSGLKTVTPVQKVSEGQRGQRYVMAEIDFDDGSRYVVYDRFLDHITMDFRGNIYPGVTVNDATAREWVRSFREHGNPYSATRNMNPRPGDGSYRDELEQKSRAYVHRKYGKYEGGT